VMVPEEERVFNKDLLERTLKWVKAEREAGKAGERPSSWEQRSWARGLRSTTRLFRGAVDSRSVHWLGTPTRYAQRRIWEEMQVDCGTSFCVAGYAVALEGDAFVQPVEWGSPSRVAEFCVPVEGGEVQTISVRAQDLLGISESEAALLFDANNGWKDLKRIAREICRARGEELSLG
jgi:hypothetical protein